MALIWEGIAGGLSDSRWSGILGSFAALVGIDLHSTPGTITVHQRLAKDSGTTVTALCRVRISTSVGTTLWFSYTDGKIWSRTTAGVWTLVSTTVPTSGNAGCLGGEEYNGYIYWATQSFLHRIPIGATIDTAAYWTANKVWNWATFTKTDTEFHPMQKQSTQLFIGDGNQVAKVNSAGTFTANALDILTPLRIKTITDFDIDIVLGTIIATTVNECQVLRWDTVSTSWTASDPIPENGINAFIHDDNYLYAQAGQFGGIYFYNGEQLIPYKRIPGTWSPTSYGEVYPQAVSNLLGRPVFGLSNGSGNPALQGVYTFGSYSKDYPKVLDLSYPISNSATMQTLEIGAVLAVGADLFVAWKDSDTYGVDKLDWSAKYASAYLETMMLAQDKRDILKTLSKVSAFYNSLPANTGITFSYKINNDSYVEMTSITNSVLNEVFANLTVPDIGSLQIKASFTISGNNAPVIEGLGVDMAKI